MLTSDAIDEAVRILNRVRRDAPLLHSTIHGEQHWQAVAKIGLRLAVETPGAEPRLAALFAILHDCRPRMIITTQITAGARPVCWMSCAHPTTSRSRTQTSPDSGRRSRCTTTVGPRSIRRSAHAGTPTGFAYHESGSNPKTSCSQHAPDAEGGTGPEP